jgi:hypothetical protein
MTGIRFSESRIVSPARDSGHDTISEDRQWVMSLEVMSRAEADSCVCYRE